MMSSEDSTTILYLTDNQLDEHIARRVREVLLKEIGDTPLVSVSQQPMSFGENICVGDIGRSWISIHQQLLVGLKACQTQFVTIAEHDCFYTHEHLSYIPSGEGVFWCNMNCWLVQWGGNHPELNGMYSYWPEREAMSQTIGQREMWIAYTEERLQVLCGTGEGADHRVPRDIRKARAFAVTDRPVQLQRYLKNYVSSIPPSKHFKTALPNLDVRHGQNFTGPKRGKRRCYEIPYWNRFEDLMDG